MDSTLTPSESTLVEKIISCVKLVKESAVYKKIAEQTESDDGLRNQLARVKKIGDHEKGLELAMYEIGSIKAYEHSRLQLALAILLKTELRLVENITVYDPTLSVSEINVIKFHGLQCNRESKGKHRVERPTLFFVPGCKIYVWNNIFEANLENLSRIIILGRPLRAWVRCLPRCLPEMKYPLAVSKHLKNLVDFPIWLGEGQDNNLSLAQWWEYHFGDNLSLPDSLRIAFRHAFSEMMWHFFDNFPVQLDLSCPRKLTSDSPPPLLPVDQSSLTPGESKMLEKMETCMRRLEESSFYNKFLRTMESAEFAEQFEMVREIGSGKLPMIVYGMGSIGKSERARLQLGLAILLKRRFEWVEEVLVYDPRTMASEIKVVQNLGCGWISRDEEARRSVDRPTVFFMPSVPLMLFDALLETNWTAERLNKIVILGNSFKAFNSFCPHMTHTFELLNREGRTYEVPVCGSDSDDCSVAFQFYCWHFFDFHGNETVFPPPQE